MRLSTDVLSQAEQRSNALGERELVLRGSGIPCIEHLGASRDLFDAILNSIGKLPSHDTFEPIDPFRKQS